MKNSEYWTTDTEHDAAFSLVAASDFFALTDKHPHYWRWFVLAAHSAVQGSFALALTNGNIFNVQKPGVSTRMLSALESQSQGINFPNPHMDNFLRLYAKAKQVQYIRSGATPLPADDRHERALISLDEMRDELVHFNSKSWSIEIAYMVETTSIACEVIEHIFSSGAVLWHSDELAAAAARALDSLKAALSSES